MEINGPCEGVNHLETICTANSRALNYFITSPVPDECRNEPCILGIDEAGRGPVLGPMVYGICFCPKNKENELKKTECDDSKALTEEKRETIFDKICELKNCIGWEVEVISPQFISNCMLRRCKHSLNEISHNSAIGLVKRALAAGAKITEVYVDTVGPAEKYQAKLQAIFPELTITVRSKADSLFPVVGAASICAKVTRDVCVRTWPVGSAGDENEAVNWGSGYPNDPNTKTFLASHVDPIFGFPDLVRFSWSTAQAILKDDAVHFEWEKIEDEKTRGIKSVKAFFKPEKVDLTEKEMHRFFKERNLSRVTKF